jgi:hypothetical protein
VIFGFQENLLYKERIRKYHNTLLNQSIPMSGTSSPDRQGFIKFIDQE